MSNRLFRIVSILIVFIMLIPLGTVQSDAATPLPYQVYLPSVSKPYEPPNIPSNPSPSNGATAQNLTTVLSWTGGDPKGAAVTYDVYFGTTNPPIIKVADSPSTLGFETGDQSGTTYNPGKLTAGTTYYWKIIAWNEYNLSTPGPVWSFTTGDGSEMVIVPTGPFQMGCDPAHNGGYSCNSSVLPLHTVTLDAYRIDKNLVTNAQYAQCVAAGNCAVPVYNSSKTRTSYYDNPAFTIYPVIYVDWQDATNYCDWAGKRLPTEAEWEKAARGSSDTRAHPWGDQAPSCTLANAWISATNSYCVGDTSAVGSYPAGASPYGLLDMAGNVYEWVNDWYDGSYYNTSPANNPPGPATGTDRVMRGGSWFMYSGTLTVSDRGYGPSRLHATTVGFRCAAPPGN